ncbi:L,D-transpeptidase family protein [Hymenobacter sp. BT491]|uniref:L,D-transpeptidase family protein n=1 Tax=Hymenobacter sp. BT491 TaxID=2766779 RepID=UPI001653D9F9|nr:L,D-transpeptidase family protein [Hymenobacter sp. BT491]MBC6990540.1 L,D-transpeptidase family protein [Hymenobacter sp. BT491]
MLHRIVLLVTSTLLSLLQCTEQQHPALTTPAHPTALATTPTEATVSQLIRAMLDTSALSRTAPGARPALQAGSYVHTFYGAEPAPAWTAGTDSITTEATAALTLLAQAKSYGLQPENYAILHLSSLRDSLRFAASAGRNARQARFDVALSDAVLRFMLDLHRGRLRIYTPSPLEKATKRVFQPADTLREALAARRVVAAVLACQPPTHEYQRLQKALAQWLREPVAPDSAYQQQSHYEQAALNLERWRWEAFAAPDYVLINLPAYELYVVSGDSVLRRHRIIIGKPQTPSPTLSSAISYFTLAPDWHVPRSIATKEILPRLQADAGYLARNNYALYDTRGRPLDPYQINWRQVTPASFAYTIRQSAGCDNALGNIVFRFANPYSVYLHDTPVRQLFAQPVRALSHGCIRVEQPMQLAAYLLQREGRAVNLPSEAECALQPRPQDVRLRQPMPLHIRYFTCAAEGGKLRFYNDVYRLDAGLRQALFAAAPKL